MKLLKEKIEELRLASKIVTLNYQGIYEGGIDGIVTALYPKETPDLPVDEETKRFLEMKIEKMHEHFKNNKYDCQEPRTRALLGLVLTGDEKTFAKGTTTSVEANFNARKGEYPFMMIVPKNRDGGSSYQIGRPVLMTGKSRYGIKRDGTRGNCVYINEEENLTSTFNTENVDIATIEQIDQYFDQLLDLAEDVSDPTSVEVATEMPVLTGELGRSLRTIIDTHKTYEAIDAILHPAPLAEAVAVDGE